MDVNTKKRDRREGWLPRHQWKHCTLYGERWAIGQGRSRTCNLLMGAETMGAVHTASRAPAGGGGGGGGIAKSRSQTRCHFATWSTCDFKSANMNFLLCCVLIEVSRMFVPISNTQSDIDISTGQQNTYKMQRK